MNKIKEVFKNNSPYLVLLALCEVILSVVCTLSFVYSDSLSYDESVIFNSLGIEKLLENMYSSTWWALILLLLAFMAIFSIASIIYKKMDYLFISISCWVVMFVLAFNLHKSLVDNLSIVVLFVPILIINIIAYKTQKEKINTKVKKKIKRLNKTLFMCLPKFP